MGSTINPENVIWGKGVLEIKRNGGAYQPCGEMQNCQLSLSHALEELMGPSQLTAIAVGVKGISCTVNAEHAKFRPIQLYTLLGANAPVYDADDDQTTITLPTDGEPTTFMLHLSTPSDGSEFELIVYGLVCTQWDFNMQLHAFVIPKFTANAYGEDNVLLQLIVPGDQTDD